MSRGLRFTSGHCRPGGVPGGSVRYASWVSWPALGAVPAAPPRSAGAREKFREAVETMPAMAFIALPDGSRTFINKRWLQYTGFSLEQASRSGWQAAAHPDDLDRVLEKWRLCLASGEPLEYEARH